MAMMHSEAPPRHRSGDHGAVVRIGFHGAVDETIPQGFREHQKIPDPDFAVAPDVFQVDFTGDGEPVFDLGVFNGMPSTKNRTRLTHLR